MDITITHHNRTYSVDLNRFTDISIPIGGQEGVIAWYLGNPEITPVRDGDFVGEVAQGSSVNFRNILFNPHAHGTHTECMGHISREIYSVNRNMLSPKIKCGRLNVWHNYIFSIKKSGKQTAGLM